ncbi:MAG: hypothetical protein NZ693_12065 [Thermoflexales bacterium]|nr:hypothetical protein [Thermoflexales bacterium]
MRALKQQGCRVFLLTEDRWRGEDWPYDALEGIHYMHSLAIRQHVLYAASYMARGVQFDLIIPLDEYEVETAALLREHFQLSGLTVSQARLFTDKLAMRNRARSAGVPVPEFTPVLNYDVLRAWMARVSPPWLLKPRHEAGAMGIKRCHSSEEVWRLLDQLGDEQSFRLLEQFVPSRVFHVDTAIWRGEVVFEVACGYGEPPLQVMQGGVFTSATLDYASAEAQALRALNRHVLRALAPPDFCGVTHAEYLRAQADGRWLFLEMAARVGGANLSDMIEFATGVNLWEEWARIELADLRGEGYTPPRSQCNHAGIVTCLARQEFPNLGEYQDEEVVWRLKKRYHAGLIVRASSAARVQALLEAYARRFAHDFLAVAEPLPTGRNI